jgi:hypothetical protein
VIHSLAANIGQLKHYNSVVHFFLLGVNVFTFDSVEHSARGTLHCRKTRTPCGDQLVICGL